MATTNDIKILAESKSGVKARATAKTKNRVAVTFSDRLPPEVAEALQMRREARYICHTVTDWLRLLEPLPERSVADAGVLPHSPEPITQPVPEALPVPEPKPLPKRETEPIVRGNAVAAFRSIVPLLRSDAQPHPERYAPDEASPVHYACKHLAPVLKYAMQKAQQQDTWQADKAAEEMMQAAENMLKALQKITDPRDPAVNLHPSINALIHHIHAPEPTRS